MSRFRIVPGRSQVTIDGTSSLHAIRSISTGLGGFVDVEPGPDGDVRATSHPVGTVSVPVSSLSSGSVIEDRELYKRVDIDRFPTIEGALVELRPSGTDSCYRVGGDIEFRGVSRHYENEMTIRLVDGETVELSGSARFDMRDFGIEPPRLLMLRVDPEVNVRIDVVALKEG